MHRKTPKPQCCLEVRGNPAPVAGFKRKGLQGIEKGDLVKTGDKGMVERNFLDFLLEPVQECRGYGLQTSLLLPRRMKNLHDPYA